MKKAGQRRKRTRSGQLSRAGQGPRIVRGNDRAVARIARFGNHGSDAIGRAYAAGLLGALATEGAKAKALLDLGRRFHAAYWCELPRPYSRCALDDTPRGAGEQNVERVKRLNAWLNPMLALLRAEGEAVYRATQQLCLGFDVDEGPAWLTVVIDADYEGRERPRREAAILAAAVRGLEAMERG